VVSFNNICVYLQGKIKSRRALNKIRQDARKTLARHGHTCSKTRACSGSRSGWAAPGANEGAAADRRGVAINAGAAKASLIRRLTRTISTMCCKSESKSGTTQYHIRYCMYACGRKAPFGRRVLPQEQPASMNENFIARL
jgi:hypothetical protein